MFGKQIRNATQSLFDGFLDIGRVVITRLGRHNIIEVQSNKRLTIVQFGDYAEAVRQFENALGETYYAQRYSVEFIASLAERKEFEGITVISFSSNTRAEIMPSGVRTLGVELYPRGQRPRSHQLVNAVKETRPTHLIVMSPIVPLIHWAIRMGVPVLPMIADSFRAGGLRARVKYRLLAFLLNDSSIQLVANHNLAASLDLERIGVDAHKIVPFDWPAVVSSRNYSAKTAPPDNRPFRLLYVGSLIETKGVGDAIQAVSRVHKRGRRVELTIIGRGDLERFKNLSITEEVEQQVFFSGVKSHSEVLAAMRDHDAVLVPSHWAYPEGLPMTLYEALCARTPLLTSDHPMFALKIRNRYNALVFPERNPEAFADCIDNLAASPELYAQLSNAARKSADSFLCPLKYDRLISGFLSPRERNRLREYSLANYAYAES